MTGIIFQSPGHLVTRFLVALLVLNAAYSTLAAPVSKVAPTSQRAPQMPGVRPGSGPPSRDVAQNKSISDFTNHAPVTNRSAGHCLPQSQIRARAEAGPKCGDTIKFEDNVQRSGVLGNALGEGNAGTVFDLTGAWPTNPGHADLNSYSSEKAGVVAKQFKADPKNWKKDAVDQEIRNLRQVKLLIDEGTFEGSRWVIMPKAPGVPMWKLDFLTKHWKLDSSSKNVQDCAAILLSAAAKAVIVAAQKHGLFNTDIDPTNVLFTTPQDGLPKAHLFDWGQAEQAKPSKDNDSDYWADQEISVQFAASTFFNKKFFCHPLNGKIGLNPDFKASLGIN